jgi:tetratricopeptide (TPR) repeat protein
MPPPATDAMPFRGKRVAFTGRLASMTRLEAAELVCAHGGEFVPGVTRHTSLLVVGQEGWPLQKNGRLTRKLQRARRLQRYGHPIAILAEEGMLAQLGFEARSEGIHQVYNAAQLCQIFHISRDQLRAWVRAGLIEPVSTVNGACYFDFRQVTGAKTLCDLAQAGVTPQRIRRSLKQLRSWMPDLEKPFTQLAVIERDGAMLVRLEEGQLAEPTGQLQFDFAEDQQPPLCISPNFRAGEPASDSSRPSTNACGFTNSRKREIQRGAAKPLQRTAIEWFTLGCEHEDAGRLDDAAQAYREALLQGGPDAGTLFNLANVLYALGQKEQAVERFRQVVEMDNGFVQAWNNLGNVLADLEQREEAVGVYQKALEVDPEDTDALYNLADLLDDMGRHEDSVRHWRAYLRKDSTSPWGNYARQRLFLAKKI